MQTSTIRPGLLVSFKTSLRGNINYRKTDLASNTTQNADDTLTSRTEWQTVRTVADAAEYAQACDVRAKATYTVARCCASTAFGYLCPDDQVQALEEAIEAARRQVQAFNATARLTRLAVYVITGRIARDDVEAARAIRAEVADLMSTMQQGVTELDFEKIRDAAKKAREIGAMLTDDAQNRVTVAIDAARKSANAIAAAVRAGTAAALSVDRVTLASLELARSAFLDLDDAPPAPTEPTLAEPARAIDFDLFDAEPQS